MSTRQIGERFMTRWVVDASLGVVSLVVALCTPGWSQNQPLSFGVIIWRSPTLTAQFWNPILRHVSERSGASKDSEFDNMRKSYRTTLVKVELQ